MEFRSLAAVLFISCASAAQALTGGEGTTKRASALDGYMGIARKCSGVMLTNEWAFTAAHCFKPVNDDGDPNQWRIWVGGHEQRANLFEVDNSQSFGAISPSGRTPDIRVMKLKTPVEINGLTTGYVNRVMTEDRIPANLIGKDLTGNSPFMELGAGSNERGADWNLRRCSEGGFAGIGSVSGYTTVKFDHDETAGTFPIPDIYGVACEYRGGDSGSATLYRDPGTGEQFVVGGCPGFAEGGCIAGSEYAAFIRDTVWGGVEPAGLSVETPRLKPGDVARFHYDTGTRANRGVEIRVTSAACKETAKTGCTTLHTTAMPAGKGMLTYKVPDGLRGRYQVRLYNGDELLRVAAFHTGGAIWMHSADNHDAGTALMMFPGLAAGTKPELMLVGRARGLAPTELGWMSDADYNALKRQSVTWVIDTDRGQDQLFAMDLRQGNVMPGIDMDVVLIDPKDRRVLDFDVMHILDVDVWAGSPRGFDPKDGLSLLVAGNASPNMPLTLTLQKAGTETRAVVKAQSGGRSSPSWFNASAADLQAAGITTGKWTISSAVLQRWRPDAVPPQRETVAIALAKSGGAARSELYFSDISSVLSKDRNAADFGRLDLDGTTTHQLTLTQKDIDNGRTYVDGLVFSAWTLFGGYELGQVACKLTNGPTRSCTTPVSLDLKTHLAGRQCFELRVHYQKSWDQKMSGDPLARANINPHAMLARRTICR